MKVNGLLILDFYLLFYHYTLLFVGLLIYNLLPFLWHAISAASEMICYQGRNIFFVHSRERLSCLGMIFLAVKRFLFHGFIRLAILFLVVYLASKYISSVDSSFWKWKVSLPGKVVLSNNENLHCINDAWQHSVTVKL